MWLLFGCESLSYYHQAVAGQLDLLTSRQSVELLLSDTETTTHAQLRFTQIVLDFAAAGIGLEVGQRYRTYVALDSSAVVWNVFAAQPDSVSGQQWCYPVVGCAPYRGYFKEEDASHFAGQLRTEGLETYVAPVPAYSTLGWFEDPLLSTFISWPKPDLASLLIHELAHGRVWVNSDVRFNESFASFVADQGLHELAKIYSLDLQQWRSSGRAWQRMKVLLLLLKSSLERSFEREGSFDGSGSFARDDAYAAFRGCYEAHKPRLGAGRFDQLVALDLNNAYLVSVGTYEDWQPAFAAIFSSVGGSWAEFFAEVERLASLDAEARDAQMLSFAEKHIGDGRNHQDADQIHCEALTSHGGDAKSAG
ncbi:MAG: putative aminopeptidase [Limisphaerales bacterium]